MVMGRIHFRSLDGRGDFRREVLDPVHPALEGSKPLQLLVLARGHEIPAHPAIAGDRDGLALRLFLVTTEGFGEFSGCDRTHSVTRNLRNTINIRNLRDRVKIFCHRRQWSSTGWAARPGARRSTPARGKGRCALDDYRSYRG